MKKRKHTLIFGILLLILGLGLGYAFLTTTLNINGTTDVDSNTWSIYFDNVQVTSGSVSASTPVIDSSKTTVAFNVHLSKPGDFYEFTVDAVNDGTIDAMIDTITKTVNEGIDIPYYLSYIVTYFDGASVSANQPLDAGSTETYKIRVAYKSNIDPEDLPSTNQSLSLSLHITYVQKDSSAVAIDHVPPFQLEPLDTVVSNIVSGNTQNYHLGDSKTISLENGQSVSVYILNTTTPAECSNSGFSQTACGFILGIRVSSEMAFCASASQGRGNCWDVSPIRTYANDEFLDLLPEVLRNHILDTYVVSYYKTNYEMQYVTTTDKVYLPDIYEICGGDVSENYLYGYSRQLDYYQSLGVTRERASLSRRYGWTRSPNSATRTLNFDSVYSSVEDPYCFNHNYVYGAFRVG